MGGGIAGLTAAYALRDLDVVLLEADDRVGGRIRSEPRGDVWLNFGAHVFGGPDSSCGRLLAELGVETASVPGRLAAVSLNGKLVSSGPVESFPFRLPMPLASRLAFVRVGIKLRLAVRHYASIAAPRDGEGPAERQARTLAFMDDRSFTAFSGRLPEDVYLLFRSTLTRSSGEPEALAAGYGIGYFHLVWDRQGGLSHNVLGGPSAATQALATSLGERVWTRARVTAIEQNGAGARVHFEDGEGDHSIAARAVVVATPAYVTQEIVAGLPADTAAALSAISYGPYVVGAFLTDEQGPMPWDQIYALATPKRSFSMLFNTANALRQHGSTRSPGGSFMVYAAADFARALNGLGDDQVRERFLIDLYEVYPQARGLVAEAVIHRWDRGLPFPSVGRSSLQPALTRSLAPVYLAGDYLGTWYTETAVQTALTAAAAARQTLAA